MSLVNIDKTEKNTAVLEIEIDQNLFNETVTKIFRSKAANITVPGFRKGKAPRNIIEKMYGKGLFHEDALNEILPAAVDAAAAESKISPVSKPEIDVKSIDENGVFVTAKYTIKPEVEIKNYKGFEAKRTIITVSEEDIDKDVAQTQKRNARSLEITDRAAQTGDEVQIDYEGFADGVPFEGGKGENQKLKLGSHQFIPGFEEQVEGKNIGDEFDVLVTFPEDYQSEELKGREAVFKVKLNSIRYEELPELDDEFAKDISEFDTLEEYRADVGEKIKKRNESRAEYALEEQLVDALLANFEADVPEIMFQTETDKQFQDYAYRMQSQGMNLDMYMKYTGMTMEQMRAQFKDGAERQVRTRLALEKIAALENIEPTEEDYQKEYEKLAEMYKLEIEKIKEQVNSNVLKEDISLRKAVEFIKANANIAEVETTLEEFEADLREKNREPIPDEDEEDDEE